MKKIFLKGKKFLFFSIEVLVGVLPGASMCIESPSVPS